MTQRIRK